MEANPGVVMTQGDLNGDTEWFRMLANEQGCSYFSDDGQSITVNQPACVAALEKLKEIVDAGLMTAANWDEKIQSNNAGTVASQLYGAWYEGTIRSTAPDGPVGQMGRLPDAEHDRGRPARGQHRRLVAGDPGQLRQQGGRLGLRRTTRSAPTRAR